MQKAVKKAVLDVKKIRKIVLRIVLIVLMFNRLSDGMMLFPVIIE